MGDLLTGGPLFRARSLPGVVSVCVQFGWEGKTACWGGQRRGGCAWGEGNLLTGGKDLPVFVKGKCCEGHFSAERGVCAASRNEREINGSWQIQWALPPLPQRWGSTRRRGSTTTAASARSRTRFRPASAQPGTCSDAASAASAVSGGLSPTRAGHVCSFVAACSGLSAGRESATWCSWGEQQSGAFWTGQDLEND